MGCVCLGDPCWRPEPRLGAWCGGAGCDIEPAPDGAYPWPGGSMPEVSRQSDDGVGWDRLEQPEEPLTDGRSAKVGHSTGSVARARCRRRQPRRG